MEKTGKRVGAALIAVLVGAALVGVGVWVWMDGNTPFGVAAIVIGAIILLGFLRSAVRRRKAK
jgi:membrane protein implicated in regulation of membrane protease activity